MIEGRYRDRVTDRRGRLTWDSGWHSKVIAQTAWQVVSALLRNDGTMRGLQYCAVGAGAADWDANPPSARAATTRLRAEVDRRSLGADAFRFIDSRGSTTQRPTDRLEVTARFAVSEQRVLREFGLFGGDAKETTNSGYLINYVIHPRLELKPGSTLTRRVRLTLRPNTGGSGGDLLIVPTHWLRIESPRVLDGVGDKYAAGLVEAGVKTIGDVAEMNPAKAADVPLAKAVELRSKARLAVRTAAALLSIPELADHTVSDVVSTPLSDLADNVSETAFETLREQLATLQLALDARYLKKITVGELMRPSRS